MACHRIEELLELIADEWQKDSTLNLTQFLVKMADESGYQGSLDNLSDEVLIYHLKMRNSDKDEVIPGIKKDYEDDFKTALLKARGIIE